MTGGHLKKELQMKAWLDDNFEMPDKTVALLRCPKLCFE